jgi:DNA-binding CsgD family transcriptional regulator
VRTRLGAHDYDQTLVLVPEAAGADEPQPFAVETMERFIRLLSADWGGYYEFTWGKQPAPGIDTYFVGTDEAHENPIDWTSEAVLAAGDEWPLRDWRSSSEPRKLSDFLRGAELRRSSWYQEAMRPIGAEHELKMWLDAPDGTVQGFMFVRTRGRVDFDERDRSVLALLRPHLTSIRARWERRHRPPALTSREAEIIELVGEGLSNAQIAKALFVSPLTVRRHLENIFGKLGVHNRTAAVAQARSGRRA